MKPLPLTLLLMVMFLIGFFTACFVPVKGYVQFVDSVGGKFDCTFEGNNFTAFRTALHLYDEKTHYFKPGKVVKS